MKNALRQLLAACLLAATLLTGSLAAYAAQTGGAHSSKGSASITIYDDRKEGKKDDKETTSKRDTDYPEIGLRDNDAEWITDSILPKSGGIDTVSLLRPDTSTSELGQLPKTGGSLSLSAPWLLLAAGAVCLMLYGADRTGGSCQAQRE